MLENLLQLVKDNANDDIINNAHIPNEKNDHAVEETANSLFEGLKEQANGGHMQDLLQMFQSGGNLGTSGNPVMNKLTSGVAGNLMQKLGISNVAAMSVVAGILPKVMNSFVNKTNDPNDSSFDLGGILGTLTGGKTNGMDLSTIGSMFSGGNDAAGEKPLGGALGGLLGKLFK